MTAGCFLDTNVLLYAVSTTPAEAPKRELARYLLAEDDWTLSVQVLQEFYVQATQATRPDRLSLTDAAALIEFPSPCIRPIRCPTGMPRSWPLPSNPAAISFCRKT